MATLKTERVPGGPTEKTETAAAPMPAMGVSNSEMASRATAARAKRASRLGANSGAKSVGKTPGDTNQESASETTAGSSAPERMIASVKAQTLFVFDLLRLGADRAMEDVTEPIVKDPKRASGLLSIAGKLALIGVAGGVGSAVGTALRSALGADGAKGVADMTKSVVKGGLGFGAESAVEPAGPTLASKFRDTHDLKLHAAKSEAEARFADSLEPRLADLELSTLRRIRDALVELNSSLELMQLQKRQTLIEWLNFKARAKNGSGEGGANVSAEALKNAGHIGLDQEWRTLGAEAVLELNVDLSSHTSKDGKRIWDLELHSMHLRGVHPNAKAAVAAMGTVGDVPINRIIRAMPSRRTQPIAHAMEVPVQTMVVGADSQILSSSANDRQSSISSDRLWWMVQHMSLKRLGT